MKRIVQALIVLALLGCVFATGWFIWYIWQ
jgi:hypothetical protein